MNLNMKKVFTNSDICQNNVEDKREKFPSNTKIKTLKIKTDVSNQKNTKTSPEPLIPLSINQQSTLTPRFENSEQQLLFSNMNQTLFEKLSPRLNSVKHRTKFFRPRKYQIINKKQQSQGFDYQNSSDQDSQKSTQLHGKDQRPVQKTLTPNIQLEKKFSHLNSLRKDNYLSYKSVSSYKNSQSTNLKPKQNQLPCQDQQENRQLLGIQVTNLYVSRQIKREQNSQEKNNDADRHHIKLNVQLVPSIMLPRMNRLNTSSLNTPLSNSVKIKNEFKKDTNYQNQIAHQSNKVPAQLISDYTQSINIDKLNFGQNDQQPIINDLKFIAQYSSTEQESDTNESNSKEFKLKLYQLNINKNLSPKQTQETKINCEQINTQQSKDHCNNQNTNQKSIVESPSRKNKRFATTSSNKKSNFKTINNIQKYDKEQLTKIKMTETAVQTDQIDDLFIDNEVSGLSNEIKSSVSGVADKRTETNDHKKLEIQNDKVDQDIPIKKEKEPVDTVQKNKQILQQLFDIKDKQDNVKRRRQINLEHETQTLSYHKQAYFRNKALNEKAMKNYNEIDDIKWFLYKNKLQMTKLNQSADPLIQRFTQYNGFMQLSIDFQELDIINKKPIDTPNYILQMDTFEFEQQKKKFFARRLAHIMRQNSGIIRNDTRDVITPEQATAMGIEHDVQLEFEIEFLKQIALSKSQASCKISEIESFVFGPFTSRFWVMRKHINQLTSQELYNLPFYAWQCITLTLKNRGEVNLIIKNEQVMSNFLKFLIYSLETTDGNRGSATKIISQMKKQKMKEQLIQQRMSKEQLTKQKPLTASDIDKIVRHQLMRLIATKYNMLRVRMKISFESLKQMHTIDEHWIRQIVTSARFLRDSNQITSNQILNNNQEQEILMCLQKGEITSCLKLLIKHNLEKEIKTKLQIFCKANFLNKSDKIKHLLKSSPVREHVEQEQEMMKDRQYAKAFLQSLFNRRVEYVIDKSKCFDLFWKLKVHNERIYQQDSIQKHVKYRSDTNKAQDIWTRLQLMKKLKAFSGFLSCTYCDILIRQIEISKEIFLNDLGQGDIIRIPEQRLQTKYCLSYRYYDPILRIAQEQTTRSIKEQFGLKHNLNLQRIEDDKSLGRKIMENFKFNTNLNIELPKTPVFKYRHIDNDSCDSYIDHSRSVHCMGLQGSKYLGIISDMTFVKNQYNRLQGDLFHQPHENFEEMKAWTGKLELRFCQEKEISDKYKKFLMFKACFLYKIQTLDLSSHCQYTFHQLAQWIDTYVDRLWEQTNDTKHIRDQQTSENENKSVKIISKNINNLKDSGYLNKKMGQKNNQKKIMKQNLLNEAQNIIRKKNLDRRAKIRKQIYFKLFQDDTDYTQKNNFFEYNIEDNIRFIASRIRSEAQNPNQLDRPKQIEDLSDQRTRNNKLKRQIIKQQYKFDQLKLRQQQRQNQKQTQQQP